MAAYDAKNIVTTTLNVWSKNVHNSVINNNGLLYYFKQFGRLGLLGKNDERMGSIETKGGGKSIEEDVTLLENDNVGFVAFNESIGTDEVEVADEAIFEWKYCYGNAILFDAKIKMNADSKYRKHKLVEMVIQNAEDTMINAFGTGVWNTSDADSLDGIPTLISDDGTTTTVGGLSTVTYPNWKNQFETVVFATHTYALLLAGMSSMYRKCTRGSSQPDLIVMGSVLYGEYEAGLTDNKIFTSDKMADAGFMTLKYNGATVLYDENCPAAKMYFLNTKSMAFNFHKDAMFAVGGMEKEFGQQKFAWPITSMANFSVKNRRDLGVLLVPTA
jgi:hypothetical protein